MKNVQKYKKHWVSLNPAEKRDLAERCQSCVAYLSQVAHGHKNPSDRFWRVLQEEMAASTPVKRKSKAAA